VTVHRIFALALTLVLAPFATAACAVEPDDPTSTGAAALDRVTYFRCDDAGCAETRELDRKAPLTAVCDADECQARTATGSAVIPHRDALAANVETVATWDYLSSLAGADPTTPWGGSPWDPWFADATCMWQLQLDLTPIGDACEDTGGGGSVPCEFLPQGCPVNPCSSPSLQCTKCSLEFTARIVGCAAQGPATFPVCVAYAAWTYQKCVDDHCFNGC
jgi:hypothetical protein